jgi:hypothetical protein
MDAKKKTFIEALHSNFGNVSKACDSCGVSRFWYYDNIQKDEEFKHNCENIDEYILDTVENCLLDQIKEGNSTSTIFYLKTKGAKRGYIEQSKIDHTTKGDKIEQASILFVKQDENQD